MAGQIIISNIKTDSDNAFSILANTGAVLFSANLASGITTNIANTRITGNIVSSQITSVSNTQITGTITASQIATVNANTITSGTIPTAQIPRIPGANMPAGSVLQVVSAIKTDVSTTTSASWADISGLSVSITPTSATSKILVLLNVTGGNSNGGGAVKLVRNSTDIAISTAATGNRTNTTFASFYDNTDANSMRGYGVTFLDSPSSTSATTYKAQFRMGTTGGGYLFNVNAPNGNDDAAYNMRTVSTITVMEIAQ